MPSSFQGTLKSLFLAIGYCILFLATSPLEAEKFQFLYNDGDQYRFYGVSEQIVTINGERTQSNLDTYKVSFKIGDVSDGSGRLTGKTLYTSQRTSTNNQAGAALVTEEYETDFRRDRFGAYTIAPAELYPVVRNVPLFPDRDMKPGDTWTGKGEELEDLSGIQIFSQSGRLPALRVPVDVSYTYIGTEERNGKTLRVVKAEYNLFFRTNYPKGRYPIFPLVLGGSSSQKIYFDLEKGREDSYEEDYSLVLTLNNGDVYEFTGTSHANLVEAQEMNKPKLVDEVKKGLEDKGLKNIDVHTSEQGVVINLDNIQFPPDSDLLIPDEQRKLKLIGEILNRYADRDILVEGHTALAGDPASRKTLSEARAAAVGNFLVQSGVRKPGQIVYRGWGSDRPVAPNDTEENKKKNRRVEITILEN